MDLYYRIAGLTVKMDSYGRNVRQAEPYRIEPCESVDIEVESPWPMLKEKYPNLSDEDGEYLYAGWNFYAKLINFGGMMLHASAVVVDGKAYIFSANSGTGKSTHTQLWLKKFGDQAYILNDDKPAIRLEDGVWYAYGTPWSGKHDISVNTRVPVAGIAMIERGETNEIAPFGGAQAIQELFRQVNRPKGMEYRIKLLELLDKLFTMVPVWKLKCNMNPEAVEVSYSAMSKGRKDV